MTNVFGDYYASGYSKATDRSFQFDAGVNIGLDKVLKGLSFHTRFSVDYSTASVSYTHLDVDKRQVKAHILGSVNQQ